MRAGEKDDTIVIYSLENFIQNLHIVTYGVHDYVRYKNKHIWMVSIDGNFAVSTKC